MTTGCSTALFCIDNLSHLMFRHFTHLVRSYSPPVPASTLKRALGGGKSATRLLLLLLWLSKLPEDLFLGICSTGVDCARCSNVGSEDSTAMLGLREEDALGRSKE